MNHAHTVLKDSACIINYEFYKYPASYFLFLQPFWIHYVLCNVFIKRTHTTGKLRLLIDDIKHFTVSMDSILIRTNRRSLTVSGSIDYSGKN